MARDLIARQHFWSSPAVQATHIPIQSLLLIVKQGADSQQHHRIHMATVLAEFVGKRDRQQTSEHL